MGSCNEHFCVPAEVEDAAAWCLNGTLLIAVRGTKPTPCDCVRILRSPLAVWPPQFYVETCPSLEYCTQVVTPYMVGGVFSVGSCPESIVLATAEGMQTIPVMLFAAQALDAGLEMLTESDGKLTIPVSLPPCAVDEARGNTAVGYSMSMSFDEAYAAALRSLGIQGGTAANVKVNEIGSQHGGFIGIDWLYVHVERTL